MLLNVQKSGRQKLAYPPLRESSSVDLIAGEVKESAVKLATSEREQAWREMAKQVAHEIKNPLTPMRLTVQSFQRKFDPSDEKAVYVYCTGTHSFLRDSVLFYFPIPCGTCHFSG